MYSYTISVLAINEHSDLSELIWALRAEETKDGKLLVHSSSVDRSQVEAILPIYGFKLRSGLECISLTSEQEESWERWFSVMNNPNNVNPEDYQREWLNCEVSIPEEDEDDWDPTDDWTDEDWARFDRQQEEEEQMRLEASWDRNGVI